MGGLFLAFNNGLHDNHQRCLAILWFCIIYGGLLGALATLIWLLSQAWKGAAPPYDVCAEMLLRRLPPIWNLLISLIQYSFPHLPQKSSHILLSAFLNSYEKERIIRAHSNLLLF